LVILIKLFNLRFVHAGANMNSYRRLLVITAIIFFASPSSLFAQLLIGPIDIVGSSVVSCGVDESARLQPSVEQLGENGEVVRKIQGQKPVRRVLKGFRSKKKINRSSRELKKARRILANIKKLLTRKADTG
jgi:hypothetical protein